MQHRTLLLLTAATTLLSSTAGAIQQTGATGGGRATSVRSRCPRSSCAMSSDSTLRARQEQLFLKIDSLRWQSENVRLSDAERERIGQEITRTVFALQASIDESMRANAAVVERVEVGPTPRALSGQRIAIAMSRCPTPGYLGVTFDGLSEGDCRNNERFIRFFKYPKIALVEASSPAEQAGILQGDTLLSLGGTDVTEAEISLTKLLVPDARVAVRVRRDGDAKDMTVTIREAPAYYVLRSTPLPARAPMPAVAPARVRVSDTPAPSAPAIAFSWSYGDGLAGARVETISEGLGAALGIKEGVLVLSARPGSPAYRSGLRDGDVIQKASGTSIGTVRVLRELLSSGDGDEGVKLIVVRERKQREVTLRW